MREILFRGQTRMFGEKVNVATGEKLPGNWVYGGIFPGTGDFSVIYGWKSGVEQTGGSLEKLTVYSSTVGQYTGLTDERDQKIFEGDILQAHDGRIFCVEWDDENGRFLGFTIERERRIVYVGREPKAKIIGNIHDNPELLEAGKSA